MAKYHNVKLVKREAEETWTAFEGYLKQKAKTELAVKTILNIEYPDQFFITADPVYDLFVYVIINNEAAKYHWDTFIALVEKTEAGKTPDWSTLRPIKEENL